MINSPASHLPLSFLLRLLAVCLHNFCDKEYFVFALQRAEPIADSLIHKGWLLTPRHTTRMRWSCFKLQPFFFVISWLTAESSDRSFEDCLIFSKRPAVPVLSCLVECFWMTKQQSYFPLLFHARQQVLHFGPSSCEKATCRSRRWDVVKKAQDLVDAQFYCSTHYEHFIDISWMSIQGFEIHFSDGDHNKAVCKKQKFQTEATILDYLHVSDDNQSRSALRLDHQNL